MNLDVTDLKISEVTDNKMNFDAASNMNSKETDNSVADVTDNKKTSSVFENLGETDSPAQSCSLSELLYDNLRLYNFDNALKILKGNEYKDYLKYNCLDIVPIIVRILQEDFCTINTENCIEEMLDYIALIAIPKEALLVFLEEVEIFRSSKQFRVLLKPLQTMLMQQISLSAKASTFAWIFFTINDHVKFLPIPKYDSFEADERKLLDADPEQNDIVDTYSYLLGFYEPFFNKVMIGDLAWPGKDIKSGEYLSYFLLDLFGKPLVFLDMYKSKGGTESALYSLCVKYVRMISVLIVTPSKYFMYIKANTGLSQQGEDKFKQNYDVEKEEEEDYDDHANNESARKPVPQLSLAVYYYFVIGHTINGVDLPYVYSSHHIFFTCIPLCLHLFEQKATLSIDKGLILLDSLLNKIEINSLPHLSLEVINHLDILRYLVGIMVYCESKECRTHALKCFKVWIEKFDNEGKYRLFTTILTTVSHPGILGVVIHEIKEQIRKLGKTNVKDENFCGVKLQNLLRMVCSLPSGETTDLLEWSDKIMGALNLLIYICICDKDNDLNFKPILSLLCKDFLQPLENGLRITKGHYELKLKDLEEGKCKSGSDVEVKFDGDGLSGIPKENQNELILQSLNWLDIMHSTSAKVNKLVTNFLIKNAPTEL